MRSRSTETMAKIRSFADAYYCEHHRAPSTSEVAKAAGISKATAYRYLVEMDDRGLVSYDGHARKLETAVTRKYSAGISVCPVVGSIPCGPADNEEENLLEYVSLPASVFGKGEHYILKASGDSMVDAGIQDGDLVVIRKDCEAAEGDIIVALTGESESTLKTYGGIDRETGEAILRYRNEERYPGREIRVRELIVQGVAKHVIRSL